MQTHWIANRGVGEPGAEIVIVNPATEEALDRIPAGSAAIAAEAAGAAKSAFTAWSRLSPTQRRAAIGQVADRLAMAREEIAELLTKEMGKPLPQSRAEIDGAIASIRSYGELAVHLRAGSQMSAAA